MVPLTHVDVKGTINGAISKVSVELGYVNRETQPIECTFEFPLAPNSAMTELIATIGDRTVEAQIK